MGIISKPNTFANLTTADAPQVNSNFDTIYTEFNGNIEDANIKSAAAIQTTKISGTAVNLSSTQTLTGAKTFQKTVQTIVSDSDSSTITFDLSAGNFHTVTLGGNRTLALSNASTGQVFYLRLVQDATGSRTVTWFSTIKWEDGTAPTLSTGANKVDIFAFICTGSNTYDCIGSIQNLS